MKKTRDASNRLLPPNRTACTRTSCVPGSLSPLSRRGGPAETKALRGNNQGTGTFHDARRPLRRIVMPARCSNSTASRPGERTWEFSSHGAAAIEPLTSLSQPSFFPPGSRLREMLGRSRRPPRPLPSPTRESLRRVSIRDAFRQQGLFIGFGGRYSPGPATTAPLLAMVHPLDDDLSPP